jgi:hypothetical protein
MAQELPHYYFDLTHAFYHRIIDYHIDLPLSNFFLD